MPATVRANKFAGSCATCRSQVPAETGRIEKIAGSWKVFHFDGQCPEARPARPAAAPAPVGIYRHDAGDGQGARIYLVRESRGQKNTPVADRRRYASVLVDATPDRRTVGGDAVRYDWDYAEGVIYDLTETERVPIDDAEVTQMMIDTGQCTICHHGMWSEKTMRRARETGLVIGPVCRTYFAPIGQAA
jgi:hypothetical protein